MYYKSKLPIKNYSSSVLHGYKWKELFALLSVDPSILHQAHSLSHQAEKLLAPHHMLSTSSLIATLHSIKHREHTNICR